MLTTEKSAAENGENDTFIRHYVESTKSAERGKQKTATADDDQPMQPPPAVNFDREELLYTLRDLLAGGSDTSVTTIRWFLITMANHPEAQTRMQGEVDAVVGRDRRPSLVDEKLMPYSQAVMLETMRRYTIGPLSGFHSATCDTAVGDLFVPAGVTVC